MALNQRRNHSKSPQCSNFECFGKIITAFSQIGVKICQAADCHNAYRPNSTKECLCSDQKNVCAIMNVFRY